MEITWVSAMWRSQKREIKNDSEVPNWKVPRRMFLLLGPQAQFSVLSRELRSTFALNSSFLSHNVYVLRLIILEIINCRSHPGPSLS